jgi:predicted nuclease with RNAse H fold
MQEFTLPAAKLNRLIEEKKDKAIEAHPTSSRKFLQMPLKDEKTIQETLKALGLMGTLKRVVGYSRKRRSHRYLNSGSAFEPSELVGD